MGRYDCAKCCLGDHSGPCETATVMEQDFIGRYVCQCYCNRQRERRRTATEALTRLAADYKRTYGADALRAALASELPGGET